MIPASITGAILNSATLQSVYTSDLRTVGGKSGCAHLVCSDYLIPEGEEAKCSEEESQLEEPGDCAGHKGGRGGRQSIRAHMGV